MHPMRCIFILSTLVFPNKGLTLFCLDGCNLYPAMNEIPVVFAISISCDLSHSHERFLSVKCVPPFQIKHQLAARSIWSSAVCSFTVDGSPFNSLLLYNFQYCSPSLVWHYWETQKKIMLLRCRPLINMTDGINCHIIEGIRKHK